MRIRTSILVCIALFSAVAVFALANVVCAVRSTSDGLVEGYLTSYDSLFPFQFARDVARRRWMMKEWNLPVAPFAFPDIPLAGLCDQLTRHDTLPAVILYAIVQNLLIAGGMAYLARSLGLSRPRVAAGLVLSFAIPMTICVINLSMPWSHRHTTEPQHIFARWLDGMNLFSSQTHAGTFAVVIWTFAVGLQTALLPRTVGWQRFAKFAAVFGTLASLGYFGNRIFLVQLTLPFALLMMAMAVRGAMPWPRLGAMLAILAVGSILGRRLLDAMMTAAPAIDPRGLGDIPDMIGVFARGLWFDLATSPDPITWMCVAGVAGAAAVAVLGRDRVESSGIAVETPVPLVWACRGYLMVSLLTMAAVFYLGLQDGFRGDIHLPDAYFFWAKKYWLPVLFTPMLAAPFVIAWRCSPSMLAGAAAMFLAAQLAILYQMPPAQRNVLHYRPEFVQRLDEAPELQRGDCGASGIHSSRLITMFSHKRLIGLPVLHGQPYYWLLNKAEFLPAPWEPRVRFTVDLEDSPVRYFGVPSRVEQSGHRYLSLGLVR